MHRVLTTFVASCQTYRSTHLEPVAKVVSKLFTQEQSQTTLTWLTYGCRKIFWHPSRWPWVKATKLPVQNLICPHDKVRTAHPIATKLGRYIPVVMLFTWLNFGGILPGTFLTNVFVNLNLFSPIEHSLFHMFGMVGPKRKQKRKWVNWMLRWSGCLWHWPLK